MSGWDPNAEPGVCPKCGLTSEDFIDSLDPEYDYECPVCGLQMKEDDMISRREYAEKMRELP